MLHLEDGPTINLEDVLRPRKRHVKFPSPMEPAKPPLPTDQPCPIAIRGCYEIDLGGPTILLDDVLTPRKQTRVAAVQLCP